MKLDFTESESTGPNLTPVIDIVFLLLIFFLVATRFEQEEKDAEVIVPEVAAAQPMSMPPKSLVVNFRKNGVYTVRGKVYSKTQLTSLLQQYSNANPGTQHVLIRGDQGASWGDGVRVVGLCNKAKIYKCRIAMREKP